MWIFVLLPTLLLSSSFAQGISNGITSISILAKDGKAIGFDVKSEGKEVAKIYLGSLENIVANKVEQRGNSLILSDLQATPTPTLGKESFVAIKLNPNDPYPEITFRLDLLDFSSQKWESLMGKVPFHFLVCPLVGAEIFHQRGWTIPTPVIDPYPLHGAAEGTYRGIVSDWSKDWTYAPPIGAYPVPVVGLWKPSESKYVAYEFQGTRLTDGSERYLASAYCWQLKGQSQFFTLVYPYGSNLYRGLRYPQGKVTLQSRFRLIFSFEVPSDSDPNFFVHNYIWQRYRELLPSASTLNEFGWLPQPYRLTTFPRASLGPLYTVVGEDNPFQKPGNISAWGVDYASPVIDYAYQQNDQNAINRLRSDLAFLMENAERMVINGEECVFWRKPIKGDWREQYGKGVPTLHNVQAWQVALAFLDAYRNERDPKYLPYIDGALRFTKHILYTRNCYDDVPEAQFAWDAAPVSTFCLRYYYTFRDDPQRSALAQEAYKLARVMTYKYLPIFLSDNDPDDNIDATFFMEPNAGCFWLGSACSNEVWAVAFALAQTYVATGDPILGHYLRGMVEKWHILFRDEYYPSIQQYDGAFAECYGLFEGCSMGKGKRSTFGGLWGGLELLAYPIGNAQVRVLCGEKAAMAFDKKGLHTNITDYCYHEGNFSFRLVSFLPGGFDIVVTFPFFDLRDKPVSVIRGGEEHKLLPQTDYLTYPQRPDSLYIKDLRDGDIVVVGAYDSSLPPLPCEIAKPRKLAPFQPEGFALLNLVPFADSYLPSDWGDPTSFAGLLPGEKILYGIPFFLIDPYLNKGKHTVRNASIEVNQDANYIFLLIARPSPQGSIMLVTDKGREKVALDKAVNVIEGWPPLFQWKVDFAYHKLSGRLKSIEVEGVDVLAVTLTRKDEKALSSTFTLLREREKEVKEKQKALKEMEEIANLVAPLKGHIAVLPLPNDSLGVVGRKLLKTKIYPYLEMPSLQEAISPSYLNPAKIWFLLYLGGEGYYRGLEKALLDYLKGGGFLLVLPSGPFPFYYDERGKAVVSAPKFGLDIGVAWERPPQGRKLSFSLNKNQKIITSLPSQIPWPEDVDQRWRGMVKPTVKANYIPILTLKDSKGNYYGEAIAYVEYTEGELKGARLLYVWTSLLQKEDYLWAIITDILRYLPKCPPPPAHYTIYRAPTPPTIDGDLSDPAWLFAEKIDNFQLFDLSSPRYRTKARMLWDDENFYIGFECEDEDIWATMRKKDDPLWEEEVVEVYIDPEGDGKDYKEFEVNPLGTLIDLNIPYAQKGAPGGDWRELRKWDAQGVQIGVKVKGTVDSREDKDEGWTVEMAIPLRNLSPTLPKVGTRWRIQLYRIDRSRTLSQPEFSSWSPTATFHAPEYFGITTFGASIASPDFSLPTEWIVRPSAGEWRTENGMLIGKDGAGDNWIGAGASYGFTYWRDYAFEVKFRILERGSDWRDGPWFAFRYTDSGNAYSLNFSNRDIQLHKACQGISTGDANPMATIPWTADNVWHTLRVEVRGKQIRAILDGREILNLSDENYNDLPPLEKGEIVLVPRRWSNSTGATVVAYKDLRIELFPSSSE